MPRKFGVNEKSAEARARKEDTKHQDRESKQKAVEEAYWRDDDEDAKRKQERKEERDKKQQELLQRKAEAKYDREEVDGRRKEEEEEEEEGEKEEEEEEKMRYECKYFLVERKFKSMLIHTVIVLPLILIVVI